MRQERGTISAVASILIAFLVPVSLSAQIPQCEKVFDYILPEWEGMAVGAEGYQIWIQTRKDRAHPAADPPTIEEQAALYGALNTGAVASDCDASRGHVRYLFAQDLALRGWRFSYDHESDGQTQRFWMEMAILHSSDPREEGDSVAANFRVSGDTLRWWVLDGEGQRGPEQIARRLRPGDPAMEVRALLGALDRAQNAGDLDAFLELVDDGIVYMPPDGPAVVGKAANAEFYRRMFDQVDLRIRHIPEQTFRDGALVVTRGRAIGTMQAGGAEAIPFDNKYLYVLRDSEDGLRFVQVMYNTGPSPTGADGNQVAGTHRP